MAPARGLDGLCRHVYAGVCRYAVGGGSRGAFKNDVLRRVAAKRTGQQHTLGAFLILGAVPSGLAGVRHGMGALQNVFLCRLPVFAGRCGLRIFPKKRLPVPKGPVFWLNG